MEVMLPQTKGYLSHQEVGEAKNDPPLQASEKEHGPADSLISDVSPEL